MSLTVEQRLEDAKEKYHLLISGQQPSVFVDQSGERVEFTRAHPGRLREYIAQLQAEIGSEPRSGLGIML